MPTRIQWLIAAGLAAIVAFSGCGGGPAKPNGKYRIVTTCGMVTDIVRQVAGEHADVIGLIGEGVDPHLYAPSRDDVAQLSDADVVIYSGLTLEGKFVETFARLGQSGKTVFAVTDGLDRSVLRQPPEFEGHDDPHVWMDVSLWSECVGYVGESLARYDAPHAEDYRRNAAKYREELKALDGYVQQAIKSIPESQRVLVTAHDAFGYFARRYGMQVRSPQGISTESEPSAKDINELVDFLVERKLPALFVETSTNEKALQAIREGAEQKGVAVAIGGQLFSDAMGAPGTYEGTYLGMLDHNATTIARALGGQAPERGRLGKLKEQPNPKSKIQNPK